MLLWLSLNLLFTCQQASPPLESPLQALFPNRPQPSFTFPIPQIFSFQCLLPWTSLTHKCGVFLNKAVLFPNCWSRWLIEHPDLGKQPNFLPRQMNLAEACSPSEINSLVRRGLLQIPSVKCSANRFIHMPTPPSATVSHSIHTEPARGQDSSFPKLVCQHKPNKRHRMLCSVGFGDGELQGCKLMVKWSGRREEEVNGSEWPPHDALWACVCLVDSRVLMVFWWVAPPDHGQGEEEQLLPKKKILWKLCPTNNSLLWEVEGG